ncbi:MAG: hypothetical protein MRERV_8c063 [Mycoplasmataceae bacterium RV_VA103A]|nr:MAG: hypothetical protein MRERV_8c063 [Mycoplasmataceae bacterium RV_VA103A]
MKVWQAESGDLERSTKAPKKHKGREIGNRFIEWEGTFFPKKRPTPNKPVTFSSPLVLWAFREHTHMKLFF